MGHGSALDLYGCRFAGRGHHLCNQVVTGGADRRGCATALPSDGMIYKSSLAGSSAPVTGEVMAVDDEARQTIERFHEALNRRDLDALGDLITDDVVFEATSPAPDGTRHVGRQAMLEACQAFFAGSPTTHFEMEEMFGAGDRVIVRWLYSWTDGHVRGVDVLRVRDGRVAESLAYVKG